MTDMRPPAIATWILRHVARSGEALIGDLLEEHRRRQSAAWYWRQVLTAVVVGRSREALIAVGVALVLAIGAYLPIPGIHAGLLDLAARPAISNRTWSLLPLVPGWQLSGVTIFALGIAPYMSAALIVQLVAFLWSVRDRNRAGRPLPIVKATWCVAIVLALIQAIGLARFLERVSGAGGLPPIVDNPGWTFRVTMALGITAGTACLMFISDQITRRRMGNGMFVVFVAVILVALPVTLWPILSGMMDPFALLSALAFHAAMVGIVSHFYRRAIEREQLA